MQLVYSAGILHGWIPLIYWLYEQGKGTRLSAIRKRLCVYEQDGHYQMMDTFCQIGGGTLTLQNYLMYHFQSSEFGTIALCQEYH